MAFSIDLKRVGRQAAAALCLAALVFHFQAAKAAEPSISFTSLLNGVTVKQGVLRLFGLKGYFFPKDVDYQSMTARQGLTAVIAKASGEALAEFWLVAMPEGAARWNVDPWHGLADKQGLVTEYKLPDGGDYVLTFKIAGKPVVRFPFTAVKEGGHDPYKPDGTWYPSGPWERYGYIHIPADARPADVSPSFKKWYRKSGPKETQEIYAELRHGGDVLALSPDYGTATFGNKWMRKEFRLAKPEKNGGGPFSAEELLSKDGDYEIVVYRKKKAVETFSFAVKDGRIQYQGRQIRDKTDPLDFIEGDRDAFWIAAD